MMRGYFLNGFTDGLIGYTNLFSNEYEKNDKIILIHFQ